MIITFICYVLDEATSFFKITIANRKGHHTDFVYFPSQWICWGQEWLIKKKKKRQRVNHELIDNNKRNKKPSMIWQMFCGIIKAGMF